MQETAQPTRRKRADRRRPATRQRIVEATVELIAEGGTGSLTLAAICRRAGVHTSGIYNYFPDLDACARAAVAQVTDAIIERGRAVRRMVVQRGEWSADRVIGVVADTLAIHRADWQTSLLILRCEHEDSVVGEAIRESRLESDRQLAEDLFVGAVQGGLTGHRPEEFMTVARLVNATFMDAVGILAADPDADLAELTRVTGRYVYFAILGINGAQWEQDVLAAQAELDARS